MNNLPDKLIETIKDENFQDFISEIGEIAFDVVLDEGVLKEVPILGSILGIGTGLLLFIKPRYLSFFQAKNDVLIFCSSSLALILVYVILMFVEVESHKF